MREKATDIATSIVLLMDWIEDRARLYCYNVQDAQDLAQDTICKALEASHLYETGKAVKPWLCAIMQNTYLTRKKRGEIWAFWDDAITYRLGAEMPDYETANALLQVLELSNNNKLIRCAVMYAEGYSYAEIAKKQGILEGTVKSRIRSARQQLKQRFALWN